MCGFAGYIAGSSAERQLTGEDILRRMGSAIAHRGPDDEGLWLDESCRIGLVHRRLSILDLSPAGHQPMSSASGRYALIFNGEIYNHIDLRR
ncbi:MAG: asparagine synthase (glutamine-hydrolyzing), partial [Gammaproteobacteria bacterium]